MTDELGAVLVRRQVGRRRVDDHPGGRGDGGQDPGGEGPRPSHVGGPPRKSAITPIRSGRSIHGQCPASGRWSTCASLAQRGGVVVGEVRRDVRVPVTPDDERRAGQRAQADARAGELVLRAGAVEAQDRPLRALVEVLDDALDERRGKASGRGGRILGEVPQGEAVDRPHQQLADAPPPPGAGDAVPAVARQEGHGVDDDEPLRPARGGASPRAARRPPSPGRRGGPGRPPRGRGSARESGRSPPS